MALLQKLAELQVADEEEQVVGQQQLDQIETQSTSTVAPFPNPRGRGMVYGHPSFIDASESEKSSSEAPMSTESSFALPGRGRGMFALRMPGMMGADKDSSSSNPPTFGRGRGVAINSSGMKLFKMQ